MKTLELNQMENLEGGKLVGRDCMLRGAGLALGIMSGVMGFLPGFAAAGTIAFTSGHCYE